MIHTEEFSNKDMIQIKINTVKVMVAIHNMIKVIYRQE